uniref:Uncharacterized protein n=1 Tax=Haptolina brevifila TaxID=156173 RepID=A0A7S2I721_9EUKA|mmetsp:Transcript_62570/g.123637  ORF Transcript_62570/g.123637 Transcript_62570/m.123637 type:complete len:139 (+) Transcript_62570:1541-1957(+)
MTKMSSSSNSNSKKQSIDKHRRYDAYFGRMAKKMNVSTTSAVNQELDKMLRFVIQEFGSTATTILNNYVKKNTVKPNMAYTTLTAMLTGDLREDVLAAGSAALVASLKKSPNAATDSADADDVGSTAPATVVATGDER